MQKITFSAAVSCILIPTYLIKNKPQTLTTVTVKHILTSCSAYKNIREKHYSNSQLSHILTNISKQHIFNYLSEINIFNKL